MKNVWIIIPLLLLCSMLRAQVVSAEYFFDTDPGVGNGTTISVTAGNNVSKSFAVPTNGITPGFHNLFVRVKNTTGVWSHSEGRLVYIMSPIPASTSQVVAAEWFMDADPGLGNGTAISFSASQNITTAIAVPVNSLTPGFHNLNIRVKNNAGTWSHYEGRLVYIMPPVSATASQAVSGEWFMDTDPGKGNGTAISFSASQNVTTAITIPANSLTPGFHNLYIRVKNNTGVWSHYEGRLVYIMPPVPATAPQVVSGEWFMDTDPGKGNGTAISFSASHNVNTAIAIPANSLTPGFHHLYIRVKNNTGTWSHYEGRLVYIMPAVSTTTSQVVSGEWFVDTDPGLGNGTAISFVAGTNVAPLVNINTIGMADGVHRLFIRVKNNNNTWSHYEGRQFMICANPMTASVINGAQQYCAGKTINLNADSVTGATSYLWIGPGSFTASGLSLTRPNATIAMAGTYTIAAIRTGGTACDTIKSTITITVKEPSSVPILATVCAGKSFVFKGQALNQSGVYRDTLQNTQGCDSIVTLTLTVNPPLRDSISRTICSGNSFTFKGQALTQSGIYRDTVQNAQGCDSIVTLILFVNPPLRDSISRTICSGNSFTFKGQTLTQSGIYRDTLLNAQGCDSIVTLTLTVNPPLRDSISRTICSGNSFTFKGQTLTQSGTYRDTVQNAQGCDSIIVLTLTVNPPLLGNMSSTICSGDSFSFKGLTLTQSGTYRDTVQNAQGCDSIVTLTLTVITIDTSVTTDGTTATANQPGATYQWLNCDSNDAAVAGATTQSFTPTVSGNYAVAITRNNCTDTSDCVSLITTGVSDIAYHSRNLVVYPNPSNGMFTIEVRGYETPYEVTVTDALGRIVLSKISEQTKMEINMGNEAAGVYVVQLKGTSECSSKKIVVQK